MKKRNVSGKWKIVIVFAVIAILAASTYVEWKNFLKKQGKMEEAGMYYETDSLQPEIAKKILRFHVRANSDSHQDQQVKLKVRDAIGTYIEPKLENAENLTETKRIVQENLDGIIEAAEETLRQNGFSDTVTAQLTEEVFPVKTYGSYTFPAGTYQALQVNIGEGKGHNWWCVLYPNMCFRGSVYEVEGQEDEKLREVLTATEYEEVFSGGDYKIHFKFLEYFQQNS